MSVQNEIGFENTDVKVVENNLNYIKISGNYEVDVEGDWEETEPIDEFRSEIDDEFLHAPAAVDDNHLIFENPENEHIEVMNMVPKHHLDSLHPNDDKKA